MKTFVFIVITLLATAAWAQRSEDIKVLLSWDPVTTNVNGEPETPDDYIVYACDKKITSRFPGQIVDDGLVAACEGHLVYASVKTTKDVPVIYRVEKKKGCLYYRVSARKIVKEEGADEPVVYESDLSNEVSYDFNFPKHPSAPVNLKIKSWKND